MAISWRVLPFATHAGHSNVAKWWRGSGLQAPAQGLRAEGGNDKQSRVLKQGTPLW
jgi:hypothetical protein